MVERRTERSENGLSLVLCLMETAPSQNRQENAAQMERRYGETQ